MSANELVAVLAKHEIADLTIGLHTLLLEAMNCIPKSDAAIGCSASGHQKSFLVWGPSKGLDSRFVTQEAPHRLRASLGLS